jgi:CPA2 family monovalent cation:H+ antiporter-2
MGVLLFQDLAVVPLLVLIPALGSSPDSCCLALGWRWSRPRCCWPAAHGRPAAHALVAHAGGAAQERRAVHAEPAAHHAGPGLADRAGRAVLALGAFVAGMLVAETEYKHQVETDIRPSTTCCWACSSSPSA